MASDGSSSVTAQQPFHVMTKPNGPACNLGCEYCFYLEKAELYPDREDFGMDEETLETYVRQYIEAQPGPVVTFAWQGGEPTLLGVEFFEKALQYQKQYAPPGVEVQNCLQTNGTLLDEEWCRFLAAEDFLVGISIDGPRELHDAFRSTRADGPTYDRVMEGLELLQTFDVEHNALCVLNSVNSRRPLDVYRFFRRQGIEWIQFIPLVEPVTGEGPSSDGEPDPAVDSDDETIADGRTAPSWVLERGGAVRERDADYDAVLDAARSAPIGDRSVDPARYGEFVVTVFEEWVRNDVGDVSVRLFDQVLEVALQGSASLCVLSETCGSQVAIEHNGDVYACDHYVDPGFRRGNVHETHLATLVECDDQQAFGEYKREGLPERCRDCDVRAFCNGGCPKNWHLETPAGESGLNYLCAGYRRFFTHVQPYLELVERVAGDGLPLRYVSEAVETMDERAA
jgi:uncharacterized protein